MNSKKTKSKKINSQKMIQVDIEELGDYEGGIIIRTREEYIEAFRKMSDEDVIEFYYNQFQIIKKNQHTIATMYRAEITKKGFVIEGDKLYKNGILIPNPLKNKVAKK